MATDTFPGFVRPDGTVGIRNHVIIVPSVACANGVAAAIARAVPEAVPLFHGHGCGRAVEVAMHTRVLANLGRHPNVAAALVVGLGCEMIKAHTLAEQISDTGKPVEQLEIQSMGGTRKATAKGIEVIQDMLEKAARLQPKKCSLDQLVLGLECGGSDAFSGITANPAVGRVSDWLVDQGGTVILTEDTEMIGTRQILKKRACNAEVARQIDTLVANAQQLTHRLLGDAAAFAIAPGNMDGGMSSIQEKSLGCIIKSGQRPITQVIEYGGQPTTKGVVLMAGPGYDIESLTGLAAAGCQAIIFTTGRGNPIGHPIVPVIKVASTSKLYSQMPEDLDINAGVVLEGASLESVAQQMQALLQRVLKGELTQAEVNRQEGIVCMHTLHPAF